MDSSGSRHGRVIMTVLALAIVGAGCVDGAGESRSELSLPGALLWSIPYPDLVVEIDHVPGREPSAFAVDALLATLREVTGKRQIHLLGPTPIPGDHGDEDRVWTTVEIFPVAEAALSVDLAPDEFGRGEAAYLHVVYLNGQYADGSGWGVQIGRHAVVFKDTMRLLGAGVGDVHDPYYPDRYERRVLIHEVGHALGLVGCAIPMVRPHDDPSSPCHSRNPESVMSFRAEFYDPEHLVEDRVIPYEFDVDDLADLAAYRERGRTDRGASLRAFR